MENAQTPSNSSQNNFLNYIKANKGISALIVVSAISVITVIVLLFTLLGSQNKSNSNSSVQASPTPTLTTTTTATNSPTPTESSSASISWSFDGNTWSSNTSAPNCPSPLVFDSPANINLATNILYPGQIRGGNYKPHGGFSFTGKNNSDITVTIPMDSVLYRGVRYIEAGETQYMFDFITPCGVFFRFDHLLTLSPKYQAIAETLPAATSDSRTTILPPTFATKGETLATAVGFTKTKNVSFDFGVYDLRQPNEISKNSTWAATHANTKELGYYAICWLNNLNSTDMAKAKSLPGSGTEGKVSDYCK